MARSPVTQADCSLGGVTIFADLPGKALERVQQCCSWRRYQPGEPIVDYLDSSDDVFFLISGEVRVTIYSLAGKAVSFRELGPGEVFGEYPAIDRGPRSASVEARKNSIVATLPGAAFRELLRSEPVVAQALLPHLVTKIRALTARVYEFSTLAVSNRIQAELLRLARLAEPGGKSARIAPAPPIARSQVASAPIARLSRANLPACRASVSSSGSEMRFLSKTLSGSPKWFTPRRANGPDPSLDYSVEAFVAALLAELRGSSAALDGLRTFPHARIRRGIACLTAER